MPWEENRQLPSCSRANGMDKSPYDCRGCHEKRERDHIPYGSGTDFISELVAAPSAVVVDAPTYALSEQSCGTLSLVLSLCFNRAGRERVRRVASYDL
jgi:hypothetical protein